MDQSRCRPQTRTVDTLDLRGADLRGADLRGRTFAGANLRGARLDDADARGCDFFGANLSRCSARRTRFDGARLQASSFAGADLRCASLRDAALALCDLEGAHLACIDLGRERTTTMHRYAREDGFPSFGCAISTGREAGYLSVSRLEARDMHFAIEAALESSGDLEAEVNAIFEASDWRMRAYGFYAVALVHHFGETVFASWRTNLERPWPREEALLAEAVRRFLEPGSMTEEPHRLVQRRLTALSKWPARASHPRTPN